MSSAHTPGPLVEALIDAAKLVDDAIYEWGNQIMEHDNSPEDEALLKAADELRKALSAISKATGKQP